jgi:hypothetical protein
MNIQENNIPLLQDVLEQYQDGTLDMTQRARKCYMSEKEKHYGRVVWIHNDELQTHSLLRNISKASARKDLLQNKSWM